MKANPGGLIDTADVIGRDSFISFLWERLEQQSLLLTAERRIGKTTILKKMRDECPSRFVVIYQDLEGISTPEQFVEAVGLKLRERYKPINRLLYESDRLFNRLGGGEVQGVKLPAEKQKNWKTHLPGLIRKVPLKPDQRLLFFWDELPLMLYDIKKKSGVDAAMEILDVIRNLRQDLNVRMILTGSIGLHHVIDQLKEGGYSNAPVNDLLLAEVEPLEPPHAIELAKRLLAAENIQCVSSDAAAEQIAASGDNWPYYIHHLIVRLKACGKQIDEKVVSEVVEQSVSVAADPWNLQYYKERIKTYYQDEEAAVAFGILDALAPVEEKIDRDQLLNLLKTKSKIKDQDMIKHVLRILELDHYLTGSADNKYQFRSKLIKKWWKRSI